MPHRVQPSFRSRTAYQCHRWCPAEPEGPPMRRLAYAFLLAILATGLVAAPATAESTSARPQNLGALLGELWTTVLELPAPENPYNGGDGCIKLQGNVVAPFSGSGVASCTVQPGTRILFSGWTSECSTFEGNGTTER